MVDLSIAMLNYQRVLSSELTPWPIEVEETRMVSWSSHIFLGSAAAFRRIREATR